MQNPQEPVRPHRLEAPAIYILAWDEQSTLCMVMETRIDRPGTQAQGGTHVARRCDTSMINGTKLLNASGMSRGRRDGILKIEKDRQVIKQGSIHLKGIWIPFERAIQIARDENIYEELLPLFQPDVCRVLFHPNNILRTHQVLKTAMTRNPAFSVWFEKEKRYLEAHPAQNPARSQLLQGRPQYVPHLNVQAQVLHAQQVQAQNQARVQARAHRHARVHAEVASHTHTHNSTQTQSQTQTETPHPYAHHLKRENEADPPQASHLDLGHFDMGAHLDHLTGSLGDNLSGNLDSDLGGDLGNDLGLGDLGDPLEHVLAGLHAPPGQSHHIPTSSSQTTVSSTAHATNEGLKQEVSLFEVAAPPRSPVPLDVEGSTSSGDLPESEHFEYAVPEGWAPQFYSMDYGSDVGLPAMYGSVAHQYPGEHDDEQLFYFAN